MLACYTAFYRSLHLVTLMCTCHILSFKTQLPGQQAVLAAISIVTGWVPASGIMTICGMLSFWLLLHSMAQISRHVAVHRNTLQWPGCI